VTRKFYEIAADIIEAQASFAQMSPDSLEQALSTVFVTLQRMKLAKLAGSCSINDSCACAGNCYQIRIGGTT